MLAVVDIGLFIIGSVVLFAAFDTVRGAQQPVVYAGKNIEFSNSSNLTVRR